MLETKITQGCLEHDNGRSHWLSGGDVIVTVIWFCSVVSTTGGCWRAITICLLNVFGKTFISDKYSANFAPHSI